MWLCLTFDQIPRKRSQRRWSSTRPQQNRSSHQGSAPGKSRTNRKFLRVDTVLRSSFIQPELTRRSFKRIAKERSSIRLDFKTSVNLRRDQEGIIGLPCSHIVQQIIRSLLHNRCLRIWTRSSTVTEEFSLARELQ